MTSYGSSLLGLNSDTVCDLDVFDYFKFFQVKDDFCCYFALFSYPEDIFAAFSSILIRTYINVSIKIFNDLDVNITDEKKIRGNIMTQSLFFSWTILA